MFNAATRPAPTRSNAPPPTPGPPPSHPPPPIPDPFHLDEFSPAWATRFATLSGALTLTARDLQVLKKVPCAPTLKDVAEGTRITRTRSQIMLGQRVEFSFRTGPRHMRGKGMPVYLLASLPQSELLKHMSLGDDKVMHALGLQRIRIRIQWPHPREDSFALLTFEEWIKVDASMTKVQLAMTVARVFPAFLKKHQMDLSRLPDYAWLLRLDAFYRMWLVGVERTENNVFTANIRYVKDYPEYDR